MQFKMEGFLRTSTFHHKKLYDNYLTVVYGNDGLAGNPENILCGNI